MASIVASLHTKTDAPAKEHGFSINQGVNWSNYLTYRPIYPASFFQRIYDYHSQKLEAAWSVGHDVGAGSGLVSSILATRFDNVVISDPNDGYATLARKLLVEEALIPEAKLRFLQEPAETSSVQSSTVDLITVCECIQWTQTDLAIKEFARELKPGGTLVITFYSSPLIEGNERAKQAWKAVWNAYSERAQCELFTNAFKVCNTGLDLLAFPEDEWRNVKRVYINAQTGYEAFAVNDQTGDSRVRAEEEQVWVEKDDEDWCDTHGFAWFQAYLATWVPRIPESDMQEVWDELELALDGKQVRTKTPLAMVFATKKE
ncbi:S-adenosyl-L-methionine-dependent methyltransferase [Xylariaceae sp. FL1651]|nr:S-adenosyl-L-methionine-dependent methyltransferase [Xylariaceae sp. FL1651]